MTPLDLDAVEQRLKAATPGPWAVVRVPEVIEITSHKRTHIARRFTGNFGDPQALPDTEFIAHAPEDVAALVAALRETRAALYDLAHAHEEWQQGMGPCVCASHKHAAAVLSGVTDSTEGPNG